MDYETHYETLKASLIEGAKLRHQSMGQNPDDYDYSAYRKSDGSWVIKRKAKPKADDGAAHDAYLEALAGV